MSSQPDSDGTRDMSFLPPVPTDLDALEDSTVSGLWLRPLGLVSGSAAAATAAPKLAGTGMAFTWVEMLTRTPQGIAAAVAPVGQLRLWSRARGEETGSRIERQLTRLSERRRDWAGLALDQPLVMGIVNATPDSVYGSGDTSQAIARGRAMLAAGAEILDIGGESTRPGAMPVAPEEEMARIEPVIRELAAAGALISIDTRHAKVMAAALSWGARIINDVSALAGDPASLAVAARTGAPVVLMHMQGEPRTMQAEPHYTLPSLDVIEYLAARIAACEAAGIPRHRIVVDPGIGFGKAPEHSLEILARLTMFHALGCGLLIGISRKSMIGRLSGGAPAEERLPGSLAGALYALGQGAQILRVHDVAETRQAMALWRAIAAGA